MSRILAIDHGEVRLGLALSDPTKVIAKPLITLKNDEYLINNLKEIVADKDIKELVIGYPIGMKGQRTKQTDIVDKFIKVLRQNFNIKISTIDERLSSSSATNSLVIQGIKSGHNKSFIDKTAAAIFLQEFLDSK